MESLRLELFTGAVYDVERTQYQILAGLKRARDAFAHNCVYPHLAHLVKLYTSLQTVLESSERVRTAQNGRVTGIDLEKQELTYEWPELENADMSVVESLIRWSLPRIQDTIEEGKAVYEFVEDNLDLETVGIVPSYVQEGYLMVPDREADELHVLRYTLSIFTDDDQRFRTLKTVHCKTVDQASVDVHPSSVKLDLVAERRDLPNPATYLFQTDVPVPYEQTLLPIVKRRLLQHISTEVS